MYLGLREGLKQNRINLLISELDAEDNLKEIRGYANMSPEIRTLLKMPYIHTTLLINELLSTQIYSHDRYNAPPLLAELLMKEEFFIVIDPFVAMIAPPFPEQVLFSNLEFIISTMPRFEYITPPCSLATLLVKLQSTMLTLAWDSLYNLICIAPPLVA